MDRLVLGAVALLAALWAPSAQAADFTVHNPPPNGYWWAGPYLGGNIGYAWGSVDNNPTISTPAGEFTQTLLSGLAFWRANVGVAFRW